MMGLYSSQQNDSIKTTNSGKKVSVLINQYLTTTEFKVTQLIS